MTLSTSNCCETGGCCGDKSDSTNKKPSSSCCDTSSGAGGSPPTSSKGCCGSAVDASKKTTETNCCDGKSKCDVIHCIAILSESGNEILIYDANGELQSFAYSHGNFRDLCFSSHGHDAGDLLTPCFDEDGHHGEPEEDCFCGVETPHIHAHIHDPKICVMVIEIQKRI
jgi:hypothetical protein